MAMDISSVKDSVENTKIVVPEILDNNDSMEQNSTKVEQ